MCNDKLIQRRRIGDHDDQARAFAPAGTASLLPCGSDRAGITAHHARLEGTDIDAQLEGVGGDDGIYGAVSQTVFDFTAFSGKISAPVTANASALAQGIGNQFFQLLSKDLDLDPALGKDDRLDTVADQHGGNHARFTESAFSDPQLPVDYRRIIKDKVAFACRRAVTVDLDYRASDQGLGQFFRILDRRGAEYELRMAAVELAQPEQATQDVGQVAAKYPAVCMDLVNDDKAQVFEQFDPLGVMRENTGMQHVWIGDDDMPRLPDRTPCRAGRIPVIGIGFDVDTHELDQLIQFTDLVGGKCLRRKEIERPRVRIVQDLIEYGQIIAERLA